MSIFKCVPCLVYIFFKVLFVSKLIQLRCREPAVSETEVVKNYSITLYLKKKLIDESMFLFQQTFKTKFDSLSIFKFYTSGTYETPKVHFRKCVFYKENQQYLFKILKRGE